MSSVNLVVFSGRVGKDPEVRATSSGKSVAVFSLAVDRGYGDRKRTIWANVETWDKTAEAVGRLVKKGARVTIVGEVDEDTWDDKNTGKKVYRTKYVAHKVDIIDFPESGKNEEASSGDDDIPF